MTVIAAACDFFAIEEHVGGLLDRAAAIRLPDLFADPPGDCLYRLADRNGLSVVAVRTRSLTAAQLMDILTYRLAQYVSAGLVDPSVVPHPLRQPTGRLVGVFDS